MNQFPKMLYRAGGAEEIHGHKLATLTVQDAVEQDAALADGWHLTTPEAVDAGKASGTGQTGQSLNADDGKPATHAELKQKATELGLTFAHNISKAALAEMIAAALPKE